MVKSKILAEGSYGCVYYPGHECDKNKKNTKYISKLIKKNKNSENEIKISNIIKKKMSDYQNYFVIIERSCNISMNKVNKIKKGCSLVDEKTRKYMMLYSKYLESKELSHILVNQELNIQKIIEMISTIFNRIDKLTNIKIVHMDLHFANMLISKKDERLYIIDFGLCMNMDEFYIKDKLNMKYLESIWFPYYTNWPSWSLEYIFIALMVKDKKKLTSQNIKSTIQQYYLQHNVLSSLLNNDYIEKTYNFYKPMIKYSNETNIKKLLSYSHTWDNYKIAYHFLSYMRKRNILIKEFKWFLLMIMNPIPDLRPNSEDLKEHMINLRELFSDEEYSKKIPKEDDLMSIRLEYELSKSIKEIKI
jgi:serine/threonine protein kinase